MLLILSLTAVTRRSSSSPGVLVYILIILVLIKYISICKNNTYKPAENTNSTTELIIPIKTNEIESEAIIYADFVLKQ